MNDLDAIGAHSEIERLLIENGGLSERALDAFKRLGVDRESAEFFGTVIAGELDPPRFLPRADGQRHLSAIVRGWDGDAIADTPEAGRIAATIGDLLDVVAIDHRGTGRFASVLGTPLLGHVARRGATTVHATPLQWLAAGGRGVVVLDRVGAWPVLVQAESIVADLPTARAVRRLLENPLPMPPIHVALSAERKAA